MGLSEDLLRLKEEATANFAAAAATGAAAVEAVRIALMGRSGKLKDLEEGFAAAPGPDKRTLGPILNQVKTALKEALASAQAQVTAKEDDAPIDVTLPEQARHIGTIHPISQVAAEVEQVFTSMGYEVIDGPHIEQDEFNFGRLNIPADHPARDAQDTFWLSTGDLLRTHTSAVQSRTYKLVGDGKLTPPFRRVVVGKVFRYEAVDATHDNTFTQVEGFVVDKEITVAHLIGTIRTMLTAVLKRDDVEVRLRPSFFPFVEPGFEVDVRLTSVEPSNRFSRWVELLGCGMIHPKVLSAGGIDPTLWQGFAFGLGMERLTMIRHAIADIRVFHGGDLRSLHQFGAG
ncbi:MAG TPA: phenylalanine--tRNA ligase subunit alpha [Planctomycetota bacterium]|nr:phenylalanine--tRNA ligase subunit alpha [Planctomycetota bacterium]